MTKKFLVSFYHWVAWRINIKNKLINPAITLYICTVILYYYIALERHRYCKVDTWLQYYYRYPEPQIYPLSLKFFSSQQRVMLPGFSLSWYLQNGLYPIAKVLMLILVPLSCYLATCHDFVYSPSNRHANCMVLYGLTTAKAEVLAKKYLSRNLANINTETEFVNV